MNITKLSLALSLGIIFVVVDTRFNVRQEALSKSDLASPTPSSPADRDAEPPDRHRHLIVGGPGGLGLQGNLRHGTVPQAPLDQQLNRRSSLGGGLLKLKSSMPSAPNLRGSIADGSQGRSRRLDTISATTYAAPQAENAANALVQGMQTANFALHGHPSCIGSFSVTGDVWPQSDPNPFDGFEQGIILSSGKVESIAGPNESDGITEDFGVGSHFIFENFDKGDYNYNDACVLEFDFLCRKDDGTPPDDTTISFLYVFGSDEYNEYVDSSYNDKFKFILNDQTNIALLPNDHPVEIDNVNLEDNSHLYYNNDPSDGSPLYNVEMDGFTTVLAAVAQCDPDHNNGWNNMQIGVADAGDSILNSWVLLQAGSFVFGLPDPCLSPPTARCKDVTVQLANGNAVILPSDIDNDSSVSCDMPVLSLNKTDFDCEDVGTNTVLLTVKDNNDNTASCTAEVTVKDNVSPMANCQDITIQLDANGSGAITPSNIDSGSSDSCGIAGLSLNKTSFDCTEIGANIVTLAVDDVNGNTATCTSKVFVEDVTPPKVIQPNSWGHSCVWPPDGRFHCLDVTTYMLDSCSDVTTVALKSCISNEPEDESESESESSEGMGDCWYDPNADQLCFRAERNEYSSNSDSADDNMFFHEHHGRIYNATLEVKDIYDNTSFESIIVAVPYDETSWSFKHGFLPNNGCSMLPSSDSDSGSGSSSGSGSGSDD